MTSEPYSRVLLPTGNDKVEFTSIDRKTHLEVGRLIHRASTGGKRQAVNFTQSAKRQLLDIGLSDLQNKDINVVVDDSEVFNIVIPEVLTEAEFGTDKSAFEDYLVKLGAVTLQACAKKKKG